MSKHKDKKQENPLIKSLKRFITALTITLVTALQTVSLLHADNQPPHLQTPEVIAVPSHAITHVIEISMSRNLLTLYEIKDGGERSAIAEYPVGSAVRGLKTYPLGAGTVTGIYFNPWWYPTPYSRQVFRERGINLPAAVPPGDPLNYMGPFKIALSHRTFKGAIYRIHGNNNPKRVGKRVTGGCFVMNNNDGLALARTIKAGTQVTILP